MLVFRAIFSFITATATFSFGAMSLVSKGSLWTSVFLLSLGIIGFVTFSLWVRAIKFDRFRSK